MNSSSFWHIRFSCFSFRNTLCCSLALSIYVWFAKQTSVFLFFFVHSLSQVFVLCYTTKKLLIMTCLSRFSSRSFLVIHLCILHSIVWWTVFLIFSCCSWLGILFLFSWTDEFFVIHLCFFYYYTSMSNIGFVFHLYFFFYDFSLWISTRLFFVLNM